MNKRKLPKDVLVYIIKNKGICNPRLCNNITCENSCELFSTKKEYYTYLSNMVYTYNKAINIFMHRYNKEDLFDIVL